MNVLHSLVVLMSLVALCLEVVLFIAPPPDFITDVAQFRLQLTVVSSFSIYYFVAAILFLYGMHQFKPEMRRSYLIITMSMAFFGFVNLQYPLLLYIGFIPGPWVSYGGSLLVIIPGVVMHYWGVRHVAKTLGMRDSFMSTLFLGIVMIIASVVSAILPHVQEIPEFWFAAHQTAAAVNLVLNFFSAGVLLAVVRAVGVSYRQAFRWLTASVILSTLGFVHIIGAALFGQNNAYTQSGITAAPFIVVSILYAITGYYFCKVRLFGQGKAKSTAPGRGMLDAVVSTANLVSDQKEVDTLLDELRQLTARLGPNQPPGPQDADVLVDMYLQLEDYLLHREKLKIFTRDGLRARLNDEALQLIQAKTLPTPGAQKPTAQIVFEPMPVKETEQKQTGQH
ncbi:MAG TPA: hypothetical protein VFT87_00110 [Candidatus Saccharimonadales bacterium]|nr:hypothetical protein [Candidatus Saccharimonadales bacterium]